MLRLATACLLAALLLTACKPVATPSPDSSPPPPDTTTPNGLLTALHHATSEMALDGFQFDKPALGWPADVGSPDSRAYITLLIEKSYLSPESAGAGANVTVANASESDPLDTALFKTTSNNGSISLVRKDGKIESFPANSPTDAFAPPPPRDPAWLP